MRKKLIAGAVGVTLAAGVGLGVPLARADTASPPPGSTVTTAPSDAVSPHGPHRSNWGRDGSDVRRQGSDVGRQGVQVAALASKLGVDEDALADALTQAREATRPTRPDMPATQTERDATRAEHQATVAKTLAAELGIDEDKVAAALSELRDEAQSARESTRTSHLDQAVTNGKLTQAEADAIKKARDAGVLSGHGGGHGRR